MPCSYKPNNTKPGTIRGYDNVISVFLGCLGSAKHYTWNCLSSVRYPSTGSTPLTTGPLPPSLTRAMSGKQGRPFDSRSIDFHDVFLVFVLYHVHLPSPLFMDHACLD